MEHYQGALRIDPEHQGALAGLGAALIGVRRYEDAQAILAELLRLAPDEAAIHLNLGLMAHLEGDLTRRTEQLALYLKRVPKSPHQKVLLELMTGAKAKVTNSPLPAP